MYVAFLNVTALYMMVTRQSFTPPTRKHAGWLVMASLIYVVYTYAYFTGARMVAAGKIQALCGSPLGVMMADTLSFNAKIGVVNF